MNWTFILSLAIHWFMAIAFFMLIPFPFFIAGIKGESAIYIKKLYRPIMLFAHIALIGTIVTGIVLVEEWLSLWTVVVVLLWGIIATFLGLTAKSLRQSLASGEDDPRILFRSSMLSVAIFIMFIIKFFDWF